jgi:hypothetical protein
MLPGVALSERATGKSINRETEPDGSRAGKRPAEGLRDKERAT